MTLQRVHHLRGMPEPMIPLNHPYQPRVLDEREYPMLLLIGDETDRGYDRHKICSSNIQS